MELRQNGEDGVIEKIFATIGTTVDPLSRKRERFLLQGSPNEAAPQAFNRRPDGYFSLNDSWLSSLVGKYMEEKEINSSAIHPSPQGLGFLASMDKYYVEFGTENGVQCNTLYLREFHGWSGLLMDGGYEDLSINLHKEFITAENITDLFAKYQAPKEFDLLSINIDYNDFYVWYEIGYRYRPRVVVIEYNATHLPSEDCVVHYYPMGMWDRTNYFRALAFSA